MRARVLALKPFRPTLNVVHQRRSLALLCSRRHLPPSSLNRGPYGYLLGIRTASTSAELAADSESLVTRLKNLFLGTSIVLGLVLGYFYITDTRASIHRWVVVPALKLIYEDPEDAHEAGNKALKGLFQFGLYPRERGNPDKLGDLKIEVFGHTLSNPIGTSAGIDKHADIPDPLFAIGPAIIEVGGVTPLPQDGNPKIRLFRLPSQNALINRYGLNSEGADHMAMHLRHRVREYAQTMGFGFDAVAEKRVLDGEAGVPPGSLIDGKLMAVQIAKNKFTPAEDIEAVRQDYVYCVDRLAPYADILVVNVSSPNTPFLRTLQQSGPLTHILKGVVEAAKKTDRRTKPAVMVKVSPDEDTDDQIAGIGEAVWESGVDGVIVGNTTKRRPEPSPQGYQLPPREEKIFLEEGGFSGPHLFERTLALVKKYRKVLDDRPPPKTQEQTKSKEAPKTKSNPKPESTDDTMKRVDQPKVIFATGGITNGHQALEVLNAGASAAMVYTALVFAGVGTISRIKDEMRLEMNKGKK